MTMGEPREPVNEKEKKDWCVYILYTSDNKLYTGITNNMRARWRKHCNKTGAKFFLGRSPISLCYQEPDHTRSSASQREYAIKQLSRKSKQHLIISHYGPHLPS